MEQTLVDLLGRRAAEQGGSTVFTRWADQRHNERHLTYGALDRRAQAIGAALQAHGLSGERILLLVPPGLDYVAAFFGCLYAGAVAVPYYPPSGALAQTDQPASARRVRGVAKLHSIAAAATPAAVIVPAGSDSSSVMPLGDAGSLRAFSVEQLHHAGASLPWQRPAIDAGSLAFLQFTSGSTGAPRGVMLTHGHLLTNSESIRTAFGQSDTSTVVSWLPPYHDMGLIGGILQPVFSGGRCVLLTPVEFLQRPRRWLEAIDRHRADTSGGPNSAYDLCVRRIPAEQRHGLNLGCWTIAFTGAEPIRADTLKRFAEAFAANGVRAEALFPCYGLAEGTLAVTASRPLHGPRVALFERAALEHERAITATGDDRPAKALVSSGTPVGTLRVLAVDAARSVEVPRHHIGEIWVQGGSVAGGYWQNPVATAETFGAHLASGEGPFLRTGDLGFLDADGHVFIAGRSRDLIILRGRNYHPADIEATVEGSHLVVRSGGCAAFGVIDDEEETLVVVAELDPRSGPARDGRHDAAALNAITAVVRAAVLADHEVEPAAVQLVVAGSVPRTTSGKIERYACRDRFLNRTLPVIHEWRRDAAAVAAAPGAKRAPGTDAERRVAAVWASVLATPDPGLDDDFFEAGGHSLLALELVEQFRRQLGVEVPLNALIEHSTLEQLAQYIAQVPRADSAGRPLDGAPAARYESFPLTDVQEAYLFGRSAAFELGGVATQGIAEFDAVDLDNARLTHAIDRIVERHDMLRAVVGPDGRQAVLREVGAFPLVTCDLSDRDEDDRERELDAIRTGLQESMLPVDRWPLFDIVSVRIDAHRFRVFARFDLLIADLHSLRLLWRELGILYAEPDRVLPAPAVSFRDAVLHERDFGGEERERSAAFWRERLPAMPPAPELPYVNTFRATGTPRFRRRAMVLDAGRWARIQQHARHAHVTASTVLLTAFADVLATWSRHPAFTLTLTFFNRPRVPHIDEVVGDFTSLLLVNVDASAPDFQTFVRAVQGSVWDALAHRHAGGVQALRELARLQGRTAHAILPVVFTSAIGQEEPERRSPWAWLGELSGGSSSTPQVVLDHQVQEDGDRLLLSWDSVDALFPDGVLDEMFAAYEQRLAWLAADDVDWSGPAPSLVPDRQLARFAAANNTESMLPPATLHGLFLQSAAACPDQTAVIAADGTRLTYGELERRSRAAAEWLLQHGVNQDELVAIVMRKGWEQVVAAVAVTRAGGAYLPIDPSLPDERRHHLMERGGTRLALTQGHLDREQAWPPDVSRLAVNGVELQNPSSRGDASDDGDQREDWTQRAYVIFTSGSTGQPKGVTIDHRGAVNTIVDLNRRFAITAGDRVFGISGLGFDLSVYDIFGTLAAGATLVLPAPGSERNPEHWLDLATTHGVTVWNSVPALFEMLCDYAAGSGRTLPEALRLAWLSGDWVPVTLPDRARALRPGLDVVSMGGATEASIWSVIYPIGAVDPSWRSVPYGRPMLNQQMHVLDHCFRPRPEWVGGDLYIGGAGVALGYWRDEEKTARSFVHPSAALGRIYRTGDLARWRSDGNLEFLGRDDGQVKIGGLRIELGEVEAALNAHPSVRQAVVVARHLDGVPTADASAASRRQLVGFVVPAHGSISAEELSQWLAKKIPSGMIPRRFVEIASLPLSSNGKVDTAKLVVPVQRSTTHSWRFNPDEAAVRDIWADAIGIPADTIGPSDNFFDIGGSSVTLVRVAGALSTHAGRNVPLLSLFSQPTVPEMARLLIGVDDSRPANIQERAARRKQRMASMRSAKPLRPPIDERH